MLISIINSYMMTESTTPDMREVNEIQMNKLYDNDYPNFQPTKLNLFTMSSSLLIMIIIRNFFNLKIAHETPSAIAA